MDRAVGVHSLSDFTGKVALVTGATGAIGFVAAWTLAAVGAKVMLTGQEADLYRKCGERIRAEGGKAALAAGDATMHAEAGRVVAETVETYGGLDIVVTAAGINMPGPITEQSDADWQVT